MRMRSWLSGLSYRLNWLKRNARSTRRKSHLPTFLSRFSARAEQFEARQMLSSTNPFVGPGNIYGDVGVVAAQQVDTYTQTAGVLHIELGGLTAGAGSTNPTNGFDQINVSGAASLNGTLKVSLLDGFEPHDGDTFDFMTFGSATGKFNDAQGLYGFGDGTLYLDVVQLPDRLRLVTKGLLSGGFLKTESETLNDTVGEFLSEYFRDTANDVLTLPVDLTVDDFVSVSGNVTVRRNQTASVAVVETLTDGGQSTRNVAMDVLTIAGSGLHAFVGSGGPYRVDSDLDVDADNDGDPTNDLEVNPNATGLLLDDVDFGVAILQPTSSKANANLPARFLGVRATAGTAGLVGISDQFKLNANDVDVVINRGGLLKDGNGSAIADFSAADLDSDGEAGFTLSAVGAESSVAIDLPGQAITRASVGNAIVEVSDFMHLSGGLSIERGTTANLAVVTTKTDKTTSTDQVEMQVLTIGGSHLQAFVGTNGPYQRDENFDVDENCDGNPFNDFVTNSDAVGITVSDASFGAAILSPVDTEAGLPDFVAVTANAVQAGLVGASDVQLEGYGVAVAFNRGGELADNSGTAVINFETSDPDDDAQTKGLSIATGTGTESIVIDLPGSEVTRASIANAVVGISDFVSVTGGISIEQGTTANLAINTRTADGKTDVELAEVNVLTIGGSHLQAFVGANGPYQRDEDFSEDTNGDGNLFNDWVTNSAATGLTVSDLTFGVAILSPTDADSGLPEFTVVKASAGQAGLVGVDSVSLEAHGIEAAINPREELADGRTAVIDFTNPDSDPITVTTAADEITFDLEGEELIRATAAQARVQLFEFVSVTGAIAFEQGPTRTLTVEQHSPAGEALGPTVINLDDVAEATYRLTPIVEFATTNRIIVDTDTETILFPSVHGLTTGQQVVYRTEGDSIGGLEPGETYTVEVLSATSLRLLDADGEVVDLTSDATGTHQFLPLVTFRADNDISLGVDVATDIITLTAEHHWQTGQSVTYDFSGGGSAIGGLTQAANYIVERVDAQSIRLLNADGSVVDLTTAPLIGTHTLTAFTEFGTENQLSGGVDINNDTITFARKHGYVNGDRLVYQADGTPIGGLTSGLGLVYVLRVDDYTIKLADTYSDFKVGRAMNLLTSGEGAQKFYRSFNDFTFNTGVNAKGSIIELANHGLETGDTVIYETDTNYQRGRSVLDGLKVGGEYYVKKVSDTKFRVARSAEDLAANRFISVTKTNGASKLRFKEFMSTTTAEQLAVNVVTDTINTVDPHRFVGGEQVRYATSGQQAIGGLADGTAYIVQVVNDHAFRLKALGASQVVNLTSAGVGTHRLTAETAQQVERSSGVLRVDTTNDTITFATPHNLLASGEVTYSARGGDVIGGLADGGRYLVRVMSATTIKLENWAHQVIDLTSDGSGIQSLLRSSGATLNNPQNEVHVDLTHDRVVFDEPHGLTDGEAVRYEVPNGRTAIGGLTNETTYFVKVVDENSIELSATSAGARIDFTSAGSGAHRFALTARAQSADSIADIDATTDRINYALGHGFEDGQQVRFELNGGTDIGLTDGATYFVKATENDSDSLQLRATAAGSVVDLTTSANRVEPLTAIDVEMRTLTIGGSGLHAFVGIGGPDKFDPNLAEDSDNDGNAFNDFETNADALGLSIDNLAFGLAVLTPAVHNSNLPDSFTALRATADEAALVGLEDVFTLSATGVEVQLNQGGELDDKRGRAVINFAAGDADKDQEPGLSVKTGTGTDPVVIDFAGEEFANATIDEGKANIAGVADFSGTFTVHQTGVGEESKLLIGATNVGAFLGVNGTGLELVDGTLGIVLLPGHEAEGADGPAATYAMQGRGAVTTRGLPVNFSGTVDISANTTGDAVDETIGVGASQVSVTFVDGKEVMQITPGNFDVNLDEYLGGLIDDLAQELIDQKSDISYEVDDDGNRTANSVLAEYIPGTTATLDDILGVSKLLGAGDYIRHYLHPDEQPAAGQDPLPPVEHSGVGPTLSGLLVYLNENWLATLPVQPGDALTMNLTQEGFEFSFDVTPTFTHQVGLAFGSSLEEYGVSFDSEASIDLQVQADIDIDFAIDWVNSDFKFNINKLGMQATASTDDLLLGATVGPVEVSIGDEDGERGSVEVNLGGAISLVNGDFSFVAGENSIHADLPIFASLAGISVSGDATPMLHIDGALSGPDAGFSIETENFDKFFDFKSLNVLSVIQMFPDVKEFLADQVSSSDNFLTQIPFVKAGLNEVLKFAEAFDEDVYSKIDFNRPRIDLQSGSNGATTTGQKVFAATGAGFTNDFKDKYVSLLNGDTIVSTFRITDVTNGNTLQLDKAPTTTASDLHFVIHQKIEKIKTLQELTEAVNRAGVLPAGVQITFDPATQIFSIPVGFSAALDPIEAPLDLGFDLGDVASLSTSARGVINASVSGGLALYVDLDGTPVPGTSGSVALGSKNFVSTTDIFTEAMIGGTLKIDGELFEIDVVVDAKHATLNKAASRNLTNLAFTANAGWELGIQDAQLTGNVSLDVQNFEVAAQVGFVGLKAGGAGTGSGVHLGATAGISLDRNPNAVTAGDRRFSFSQIFDGAALDALQLNFEGDAYARLKGLTLNAGIGSDLPIAPQAEVAIYVQDLLDFGSIHTVYQNPALPFVLEDAVAANVVTSDEVVVVLPDLGKAFDFSDVSFLDIVQGVRSGIEFLGDALENEPFYNEQLPVINRSLSEVFSFVDDFAAKVETIAENPAGAIQEVESVIENALGITDDNTLDPQDQKFSMRLNGTTLDLHISFGAIFSELYNFSLDLGTLLPNVPSIGTLSDLLGGSGNIQLEAFAKLSVDVGINFGVAAGQEPEIFLYDYNPTRDKQVTAAPTAFTGVAFAPGSSSINNAKYLLVKNEFLAAIAAAKVGQPTGTQVTKIRAAVVSSIDSSVGSNANTDSVYGANQLLGRRQMTLQWLESKLSNDLGVEVTLYTGRQVRSATATAARAVASFEDVDFMLSVPVTADKARGTNVTLGARVVGSDLEMGFQAGPIAVGVTGGYAVLDGDGNRATKDYATFTVALDQKANTANDDGKFHLASESFGDNIQFNLTGAFDVNLPVRIDLGGLSYQLQTPLRLQTNPVYAAQGLRELFNELTHSPTHGSQPALVYSYPDIAAEFEALGGSFSIVSLINDPSIVIDGIDTALGSIEDVFSSNMTADLPLIGDKLKEAASFLGGLRTGILSDLRDKLSGDGKLIELVQDSLFDLFGPNNLGILRDNTDDGHITKDDVVIGWFDKDGQLLGSWTKGGGLPAGEVDAIQFDVGLGGLLYGDGIDIPLDIDLPGFALNVDGGFAMELGWAFDFGFGLSVSDGFYLTTNMDAADPEFSFTIDVFLDGSPEDPGVTTAFIGSGKLLFFKATIQDTDRNPNLAGFQPSGLTGGLTIDYTGNSAGRMTVNHILSQPLSELFDVNFGVDADVKLDMTLELDGAQGLPKVKGDLAIDWHWDIQHGASDPVIELQRFRVDVGSFVSDFLKPIAQQIQTVLEPFRPIVNGLTAEIPGLGVIIPDPNLMGLINLILKMQGKKPVNWAFVYAAKDMLELVDQVNAMLGESGEIYLGTLSGLGTKAAVARQATAGDLLAIPEALRNGLSINGPAGIANGLSGISGKSTGGVNGPAGSSTPRSGFKAFEYIKDIGNWMNLLTGGDATLFTYEMPLLEFKADFSVPLIRVPIGPVVLGVDAFGGFRAAVDLAFGYDTYGIRKAIETGNPLYAFDGFYVSDFTLPQFKDGKIVPGTGGQEKDEFTFNATIGLEANVSLAVVKAGLRAAIELGVGADLQDIARSKLTKDADGNVVDVQWISDGKIRGTEIATMFEYENGGFANLFNLHAGADLVGSLVIDIFALFGYVNIVDVELFRVNLFNYEYNAPRVQPYLARQEGSTLYVNAGSRAGDRRYFNTDDGNETFIVSGANGTVNLEYYDWYQTYTGITNVVADMGAGDDVFDASRLKNVTVDVRGGVGEDKLFSGSAGGKLDGGAGDDRLTGKEGRDTLIGGTGEDRLTGGDGDDRLEGNEGVDNLNGGAGFDTYAFSGSFGVDRFQDPSGNVALDFGDATQKLTATVAARGIEFYDADENRIRVPRAPVTNIQLGKNDDTLFIRDFPERSIAINDAGGNDSYQFTAGRAQATKGKGTITITDTVGAFDEISVEQTNAGTPLELGSFVVVNGREVINYTAGIERLTVIGKAAQYDHEDILDFGGKVSVKAVGSDAGIDLKTTGLRIIADKFESASRIKAGHAIFETLHDLNITQRINAGNDGYIDARVYADGANIRLKNDLLVSSGDTFNNTGAGWVRLTAPDGSIFNDTASYIRASGSHFIAKAKNSIGTIAAPILTLVSSFNGATSQAGSGDIVISEIDDLMLIRQGQFAPQENPGLSLPQLAETPEWLATATWDDKITTDWFNEVVDGHDRFAIATGNGNLDVTLLGRDATLTHSTGQINARAAGSDIVMRADDMDFLSGENQIIGTGDLTLRARQGAVDYYLGSAGETAPGTDLTRDARDGTFNLSVPDFASIADDFNVVTIGHSEAGKVMHIGDIEDDPIIKYGSMTRDVNAALRNHTQFVAETIYVQGDVQAPDDLLEIIGHRVQVDSQNYHEPLGLPDSQLSAKQVQITAAEQLVVVGAIIGQDRVEIDITESKGKLPFFAYSNEVVSLKSDVGSRIESLNPGSVIDVDANRSIQIAGRVEVHGASSKADLDSQTKVTVLEGGLVVGRDANALLRLNAGELASVMPGGAVTAGARFDDVNGRPVAVQTAEGADVEINSPHELFIGGSVTSSDGMQLNSGTPKFDHSDYFSQIATASPNHPLLQQKQYGILLTGTLTTLAADSQLTLASDAEVIIRGNINVLGHNSDLLLQSDKFVYAEGFVDVQDNITIEAGRSGGSSPLTPSALNSNVLPLAPETGDTTIPPTTPVTGSSIYVHPTSRIVSRQAGSTISITGEKDVDLLSAIVAGGTIGKSGVTFAGDDSRIDVRAGEQVFLDSGLLASGNVTLTGGTPGADDEFLVAGNRLSVLVTTAGGITAAGMTADDSGGGIRITGQGDIELLGNINAGANVAQSFDSQSNYLGDTITYSDEPASLIVNTTGRAFIGGHTRNQAGQIVETGGLLRAAHLMEINGTTHPSQNALLVHAASEMSVNDPDGIIRMTSGQNASVLGLFVAGGRILTVNDATGTYLGRVPEYFDGDSTVDLHAQGSVEIGQDMVAGRYLNVTTVTGTLTVQGSGRLQTLRPNSEINLNSAGAVNILPPGHLNEVEAQGFMVTADGKLTHDVTLHVTINKVDFQYSGTATITVAQAANNTGIADLRSDIQAALEAGTYTVVSSNNADHPVGSAFTHLANDPTTVGLVDPDMQVKLRNGKFVFTSPYAFTLDAATSHGNLVGLSFPNNAALSSTRLYAIDAAQPGSVVNLGTPATNGQASPTGKLSIGDKVRAYSAINLNSGTSPDGVDIDLGLTGVLETIDGNIEFTAGTYGDIRGSVIAHGVGRDVILNATNTIRLRGHVEATDDIIVSAGATVVTGQLSVQIDGTSTFSSSTGEINITGLNDVLVDGVISSTGGGLQNIELRSEQGTLTVGKTSGCIESDAPISLTGKIVDVQGVVRSTRTPAVNSLTPTYTITIDADDTAKINGDLQLTGSILINGDKRVEIFNTTLAVTTAGEEIRITGNDVVFGKVVTDSKGKRTQQGSVITAKTKLDIEAANSVDVGSGSMLLTSDTGSEIEISADKVTVAGALLAGAKIVSGAVVWSGHDASIDIDAKNSVSFGGIGVDVTGKDQTVGGTANATGDISIDVTGNTDDVSVTVNSRSRVSVDPDRVAGATHAHQLNITTTNDVHVFGVVEALHQESTLRIDTDEMLLVDGIVQADANMTLIGGNDETDVSLLVSEIVLKTDSKGRLLNSSGLPLGPSDEPVRLSGGSIGTLSGGHITITAAEKVILSGNVGQPRTENKTVTVDNSSVTVTDATDVIVTGNVQALDKISITADTISVLPTGVVRTRAVGGDIEMYATNTIVVAATSRTAAGRRSPRRSTDGR